MDIDVEKLLKTLPSKSDKKVKLDKDFQEKLARTQLRAVVLTGLADGLSLIDGDYLCRIPETVDAAPYNASSSLISILVREIKELNEELEYLSDGIVR